ncbi:MAG: exo-alpha-sialidase [Anaerolineae bacterium]|nr:exo-alpha-sialidase [Anaerolineae bacterium]
MKTPMRLIVDIVRFLGTGLGLFLIGIGLRTHTRGTRSAGVGFGALLIGLGGLFNYWMLRPNRSRLPQGLEIETWRAVDDGLHNSNSDLIYWQGAFYLIHAAAPFHFASTTTRLVLRRSTDAHHWEEVTSFQSPGEDIRDPKFAAIGKRLYIYYLPNRSFDPEPYTTACTWSEDGVHWQPAKSVQPEGWLFWRPKSRDGRTWYAPAYWWEHGASILLKSGDGESWERVSVIHTGDRNDETDIEFLPDGHMLATARLEHSFNVVTGDPLGSTLIASARAPYVEWEAHTKDRLTRLDGPCLFAYNGRVYALGRFQPVLSEPFSRQGGVLSRKRTALYVVEPGGLIRLGDLPSAGDTSYGGVALRGDDLYLCYYTSDIRRDPPWLIGMVLPSEIRMARLSLSQLEALALAKGAAPAGKKTT